MTHTALRIELAHDEVWVESDLSVESIGEHMQPLELDGRGLRTSWVRVDGRDAGDDAVLADRTLTLALSAGPHVVSTRVRAKVGAAGDKGFVSHAGLLSTNLEPEGFRRLTWCQDRPSVRSTAEVTLIGDPVQFPVMLANGALEDEGLLADGRRWARFSDPVPKPSYLFAVLAGPVVARSIEHRTGSGRSLRLTVIAPAEMIDGADFALQMLDAVMHFDEDEGAREHDLDELIYAAVPGYPDATEYHGLMFFDPSLLIADTRGHTDDDLLLIVANVAHEYGHQARGNRVTVRSWGQLALKEGLTVLTAQNDFRRHLLGPSTRVLDVLDLRRLQFPEEVTLGVPVLRGEVDDPASLYNRTTYLKGAEIFGMIRTAIGERAWRQAFASFNRRFDLAAAGVDDFIEDARRAAPERTDEIDGIARWFVTSGRPSVMLSAEPDRLAVRRDDRLGDQPPLTLPLSVGFVGRDGTPVAVSIDGADPVGQTTVFLHGREHEWVLHSDRPFVVSPLRGYSSPVDLVTTHDAAELGVLVRFDPDPFARWWAAQELMIRAIDSWRHAGAAAASPAIDELVDALKHVLTGHDDHLLLAQLLAVPDEFMLGDRDREIDVDGVAAGLDHLRSALGRALFAELVGQWKELATSTTARGPEPRAIAQRMLTDPLLALLVASGEEEGLSIARAAIDHPEATVGIRAFGQLAHSDAVDLDVLAAATFERWSSAPRLVDRWIRAQTGARRADTIERVGRLASGPLYDRRDRSRVMAVWFPFATRNRSVFHHRSGQGYRLFADELAPLLASNAGTAVRLVGDLLQFQRFDPPRAALIRSELERLVEMPGLPEFAVGILRHLLA